ncbi:MAG: TetR/AcrR family transcriptional regulator [Bacteroidia bacterium]|jgi:AcrR family transcriptional regulator|nr:TetR/AcrR family transcriptional regulator [Bacteroidia bacterium]
MKNKIIANAIGLFLKLGFKSVTMDDIASEMCISKKTIYRYFCNKELLIKESTAEAHKAVHKSIDVIVEKNYNAIEENFEIRKMLREMFKGTDSSPTYQLKKHYSEIYNELMTRELHKCNTLFKQNIEKGIRQELYRKDLKLDYCVLFYYTLIFNINGNTSSEKESNQLELEALEYHTRAMATPKGLLELEKQLQYFNV